jgi:hypothetical protein
MSNNKNGIEILKIPTQPITSEDILESGAHVKDLR